MADAEKELEEVLLGVGNRILTPPSAVDDLLSLLDQAETLLSRVEQSPSQSMSGALDPSMKGLTAKELLGHPDADVKVSVASCISEITRITAPEAPYDDDLMKDIFRIIVQAFEKLDDMDSRSYSKRVSILETVAKVRSCVVMLDLECDALILEMFGHFLKTIRDNHPENVFSSMEMIMTVVVEESEDISSDLLSCLLVHVKKDNKDVSQIARRLVEKVIGNCASKLKPCLMETVRSLGTPLEGYSEIVASLCQGNSDVVGSHDLSISGKCLADDNRLSETTISDELPKGSGKREPEANHLEDVGAAADKSSKSSASSGAEQVVKKVEKSDAAAMDHSAKKARGKSSETTGASQAVKGREAAGLKSATTNGNKAEATHGRRPELEDGPEKSAVTSKSPDAARPKRGRPPGSKNSKNKMKTGVGASAPPSGSRMSSVESKEGGGAPSVDVRSRKQAEGPKRAAGSSDGVATPPGDLTGRLGRKRLVGKSGEGDVSERRRGSETKQRRSSKGEASSPRKDSGAGVGEEVLVETPKAGSRKKRLRGTEEEQEGYDGSIVGAKIKVWWPDDRKFYRGVIDSYDPASMKHKVLYVDGDEEDLLLKNEVFKFLKDGGPARDDSTPAAGTGRSRKKAGKLPDAPPPTSPSSRKSKSEGMVSSNGGDSSSGRKKIAGRRGGGGSNGHGGRRPAADANGEPSGKKQRRS